MRTAPVALAYLNDEDGLVEAAATLSALTHYDPEAGEACVLWCLAIRDAVLTGQLDVRVGLPRLAPDRSSLWTQRLDVAESSRPADFSRNGWVVEALQAAWSAIATTAVPDDDPADGVFAADHLRLALEAAVRGGRDADTVAAIAGGLLGGIGTMRNFNASGLLARVSLCRVSADDVACSPDGIEVRLIDRNGVDQNPNLDFVLADTVRAIQAFRAQGREVMLHCVQAQSRTPAVAALYGMRLRAVSAERALADVLAVMPRANPIGDFRAALARAETADR